MCGGRLVFSHIIRFDIGTPRYYQHVRESTNSCLRASASAGRGDSLVTRCWGSLSRAAPSPSGCSLTNFEVRHHL